METKQTPLAIVEQHHSQKNPSIVLSNTFFHHDSDFFCSKPKAHIFLLDRLLN